MKALGMAVTRRSGTCHLLGFAVTLDTPSSFHVGKDLPAICWDALMIVRAALAVVDLGRGYLTDSVLLVSEVVRIDLLVVSADRELVESRSALVAPVLAVLSTMALVVCFGLLLVEIS